METNMSMEILKQFLVDKVRLLRKNGVWEDRFDPSKNRIEKFYTLNGDAVQVPYMCQDYVFNGCYTPLEGFSVLRLLYEDPSFRFEQMFAMYIFLPEKTDGLSNITNLFSSHSKDFLTQKFKFDQIYYIKKLRIPNFKFNFKFNVSKMMERLGLIMDESEKSVGISSSDGQTNIPRNRKNFHSASIEVNENGTEAASADYGEERMGCSLYSTPKQYVDFVVDHPFFFMIREDKSRTPIFFGTVVNPLLD
ncbi:serpin-Z1-like [Humulus lupulus]|uniref:serpin-Z1-like n=1 Tax=Humulus lupulus TaxID=3486 RepID=UPI002B410071|nr:serpin-Z1-like [Humulus lupulus]